MKPQHPGEFIGKLLNLLGKSQKELSVLVGKSKTDINLIIKGLKDVNTDYAIRFSIVFEIPAKIFLDLQTEYDLRVVYRKNIEIYKEVTQRSSTPIHHK